MTDHAREAANEIMALDHRTLKHNPEAPRRIIQAAIDAACAERDKRIAELEVENKCLKDNLEDELWTKPNNETNGDT